MKKYIKPQTTVLTVAFGQLMQTGSIISGTTDTQLTKEEAPSEEDLYKIFLGWE